MAPTFYHYLSVPMDEKERGSGIRWRWLVAAALATVILAALVILLIIFAVWANSESCRDGLRAQEECRNTTRLLQRQLTGSQDNLAQAEAQAGACNRTVVTLQDALEKNVSQIQKQQAHIQEQEAHIQEQEAHIQEQQAHIQELESKVEDLKQQLKKLRTAKEASSTTKQNSAGSMALSSLLVLAVPLFLLF